MKEENMNVDFKVSSLVVVIIASIISYKIGKKTGYEECVQNIAKITNTIVE